MKRNDVMLKQHNLRKVGDLIRIIWDEWIIRKKNVHKVHYPQS